MTNADKYLKDGVDVYKFVNDIFENGETYEAYIDDNNTHAVSINKLRLSRFLLKNVKPTLTEDEKVILRNALESGADAIFRNDEGIYFHTNPATKGIFGNIFQFIKPRRRI